MPAAKLDPRTDSRSPTTSGPAHSPTTSISSVEEPDRPRLTEDQKRQNHIKSEHKRRDAIREQMERLAEIIPGMSGRAKSEGAMLEMTVKFLQKQIQRRKELVGEIEALGGVVDEVDKAI